MDTAAPDDSPVFALCYVSKANAEVSRSELDELVRQASFFNHQHRITGFLCLHQDRFFQYLEGDLDEVRTLLDRIKADPRHQFINTVVLGNDVPRRYADWSMMRINPASRGINSLIDTITNIVVDDLTNPTTEDVSHATLGALLDCLGEDSMRENIEADFVGRKIIAIGASAGGITPIKNILASLPKDIDASILLVLHLSPSHKTVLDEILQRDTGFPVVLARDHDLLLPGKVNLIPPSKNIQVQAGRIRVIEQHSREDTEENQESGSRVVPYPVDVLFSNLAKQHGKKVIGIILSGSGNDGARGAKHLQEAGAIVIAQTPETADFESMPNAVISAGAVDRVMDLEDIGNFVSSLVVSHTDVSTAPLSTRDLETTENILSLLALHDIDFTGYKRQTIINRLQRRKALVEARSLEEYHDELANSEQERALIKNDMLISVTEFFRDAAAWKSLEALLQEQLLDKLSDDEVIRVWIPGCATGEEAYTMAIVLMELLSRNNLPNDIKIFATDLSENALTHAAEGTYKCASVMSFTDEQLHKYFHSFNNSYQISSQLKEKVIFSRHNLIKDAPFTNMHLVCCRNVIIYMDAELQSRVLRILNFALVKGGILFLGPSESTGAQTREFSTYSQEWNIHVKQNDKRMPIHLDTTNYNAGSRRVHVNDTPERTTQKETDEMYQQGIEALCLSQHKTALIINGRKSVELVVCDPNGLLEVARGQPGASLDKLLVGSLVPAVVVNLQRLIKTDQTHVTNTKVPCIDNHGRQLTVDIAIHSLNSDSVEPRWLLTFEPVTQQATGTTDQTPSNSDTSDTANIEENVSSLKATLDETQKTLFETVQELEMSNDEQKDAFEQLSAANEELQSTNEELQSVNEELYTVNFEYQSKIHELSDLTNDMNNLMRWTSLGVVFVDSNLRIRRFTDQAGKIANLMESDINRPVSDIANQLKYPELTGSVSRVISLNKSEEIDIEYDNCKGRLHLGIYPYTVESEFCQGAVITLLDLALLDTFNVTTEIEAPELENID